MTEQPIRTTDDLLSLAEAAEALNVSEITIKRYIYAGKLKSHKLPGGRHRIPRSELGRLLEGAEAPPAAEEVVAGLEDRVEELEAALEHVSAELQVLAAWCARRESELPPAEAGGQPARRQVEVLGPGCAKCRKLHELVMAAVNSLSPETFDVSQVTALERITEYGPVLTPALVVDGRLVASGRMLSGTEIERLLKAEE